MFKKGLLALALVFSLPVSPLNTGSMFVFQRQYQQEHVQGPSIFP
ncbi:phage shock protein E (rhodanase-like protein) [Escherichia coli]|uniref:Phage shock protein E (Rhodanase-like protein) n=1 Tax=Escherichia coli TaxID=562 RepID=A0A377E4G3_ECOLX|nr:phage shock protein E (rhodanase-like protein) [Escherichia coli]